MSANSGRWQREFDLTIGQLDRCLSFMIGAIREADTANRQTLKHHAEDMILAGLKILKDLGAESSLERMLLAASAATDGDEDRAEEMRCEDCQKMFVPD